MDLNDFFSDSFPLGDYSSSLSFFSLCPNTAQTHTTIHALLLAISLLEIKICFLKLPEAKVLLRSLHSV